MVSIPKRRAFETVTVRMGVACRCKEAINSGCPGIETPFPPPLHNMPQPQFKTSDGQVFELEPEVTQFFTNLNDIIAPRGTHVDKTITLGEVSASALERIVTWCRYHKDDVPMRNDDPVPDETTGPDGHYTPYTSPQPDEIRGNWDLMFIMLEPGALIELMNVRVGAWENISTLTGGTLPGRGRPSPHRG